MSIRVPCITHAASRSMRTRATALLALCGVLAFMLAGCGIGSDPLVAFNVDGHAVSMTTYQRLVDIFKLNAQRQGQTVSWQSPDGRATLASAQYNAINLLTMTALIHERAQATHATVSVNDLRQQVKDLSSFFDSWSQQLPANEDVRALHTAAAQASKDAANKPDVNELLASRSSLSDAILILAEEQAEANALLTHASVPAAQVRVILLGTKEEADSYKALLIDHKADFGDLARQHSLDKTTAQNGGVLSAAPVYVGEYQALDDVLFGSKANYRAATDYEVATVGGNGATQYVLCEITGRTSTALASIADPTTRSNVLGTWLTLVVRPVAHVQQYIAIDPTPTAGGQGQ